VEFFDIIANRFQFCDERQDKRGVDLSSDALPSWLPMVLKY
jgi:hypothetical protein